MPRRDRSGGLHAVGESFALSADVVMLLLRRQCQTRDLPEFVEEFVERSLPIARMSAAPTLSVAHRDARPGWGAVKRCTGNPAPLPRWRTAALARRPMSVEPSGQGPGE